MAVDLAGIDLPALPGVYLFKTSNGRVLYVGKATRLSDRIRSYFASTPDRAMIPELVARADDVECIVTPSPSEALVLERQLIREHKPRFNSLLKDDKSFPYLVLTGEALPRIMYTRHPPKGSSKWGPFPNAGAAKQVMQLLRRHLGLRDCKELLPQGCLAMHIGLCAGPCIDAEGYAERVEAARRILNGDASDLLEELSAQMDEASTAMAFEQAALVRDRIRAVREVISQHVVSSRMYRDCDAIGVAVQGDLAAVVVLHADEGVVQGQEVWPMVHRGDLGETVSAFVAEHYESRTPPRLLLTPTPLLDGVEAWLEERRERKVECRVPARGDLATLRRLADQNAEVQVRRLARRGSGSLEQQAADEGALLLGLDTLDHVVCFDMAQLQGAERVGASVVMRNGRPAKKEYRTYTVKGDAMDDLRMMQEVVGRWLKRQDEWPDLLLLDGGQTHLDAIRRTLEEAQVWGRFPVAALAKREETVHRFGHAPLVLDRRGRVLVHARDEAHRFVNTFHRRRRGRSTLEDPLEGVEGLGAKKMQALLRHFGGRKGIEGATVADLRTVPGIGRALAERIHEALHGTEG
jgi:excinuclease ABC subunit C